MEALSRFLPYLEKATALFHQIAGPSMRSDFLLAWVGLAVLGLALKHLGSWLSMLRILVPLAFIGSCVWLAGRSGTEVLLHTWRGGIAVTLIVALFTTAASSMFKREDMAGPSVLGFVVIPVFWHSRLTSYLETLCRLVGIIRDDTAGDDDDDDEPARSKSGGPFDLEAEIVPNHSTTSTSTAKAATAGPFPSVDKETDPVFAHAAEDFEESHQQLWNTPMQVENVKPSQFKHLDLKFYDKTRKALEGYNFKHLGDIEVVSLRTSLTSRVMIRNMLSPDQVVSASCFHCKGAFWLRAVTFFTPMRKMLNTRTVDFESEFNDGSFVVTTNSAAVANFDYPDHINSLGFPDLKVEELGSMHYQRVQEHANQRNCLPRTMTTLADSNAMQARLHAAKSAGRGEQGMSREEFRRVAGKNDRTTDQLYDAWQDVRKQAPASGMAE